MIRANRSKRVNFGSAARRLALVSLVLGLGTPLLGSNCEPALIVSVSPADGGTVATFSFPIVVELGAAANPATLTVELNGEDITSQFSGGPTVWTANLAPGAPLQDQNQLVVGVAQAGGSLFGSLPVTFDYLPPKARAFVITDSADCPTGPIAHCTVGDYLLGNETARFVVQKPAQRDMGFVATYGGNLIDAEIVENGVPHGHESFLEFQPSINIESVVNAQTAEVVNDGQDGTTAIVRTCGPDDLLDDINPSSVIVQAGGQLPAGVDDVNNDVWACTEYRLDPETRTVEVVTTIENLGGANLPLFVGDYINGGGELEQFTPLSTSAPVPLAQAGVGEMFANWGVQAIAFFGYGEAEGVDYALVAATPPAVPSPSSTFTQTGVSFVLHGNSVPLVLGLGAPSNFSVPAGGTNFFRRWFTVGDGSAANAVQAFADVHALPTGTLRGCVTDTSGDPLPGARVAAGRDSSGGTTALRVLRGHWVADADGCYEGRIPTGNYLVAAAKEGYPYEGGGTTATTHLVSITSGGTVVQDVVLPETGALRVEVVDHLGDPMPARIAVVGFDPSPEPTLLATVLSANDTRTNLFYDLTADGLPAGISRTEYTEADGTIEFALEPGSYQVAVSRGGEWSLDTELVTITANNTTTVNAQLARVLDTTGWISADYHVHMIDSPDSRVSRSDRIRSYAGEGVDSIIATDHAYVTDLDGQIASMGFTNFVNATPGEEVTTFDYGHFNAYPQGPDASRIQTKGSTDHAGAAPPGQDFPSLGNYTLSPAQIEAAVMSDPDNAGLDTVVQINHIDSHFDPLKIDTAATPPRSFLGAGEPQVFRLDPSITNFFHHFPALELWNGDSNAKQVTEFFGERIGIWMNLLNHGMPTTFIADTDTHQYHDLASAGARTWTPSSTDAVAAISDNEIGRAIRAGKAVGGQGVFVTARLLATDGSGGVAQLAGVVPSGTQPGTTAAGTLVSVTNGEVNLEIRVQAPTWAPYDRIVLYRNATTTVAQTNDGIPTLYGAQASQTLTAGVDFTVATVPVNGSARYETNLVVPLTGLTEDEWIVVAARGVQGVSPPMFPVYPNPTNVTTENPNLAALTTLTATEQGVRALGVTNALFVDVDGNGMFDAPGPSVAP